MKSKPVLVTLVLGTVMLALLSYFFVKSAQKPGVPSPVKLPAELAALPGKKREPASSRPLGELPLTEQRRALGLRNTRLSEEQGKSRLRVRTRAKGWCYGGDLDAIRLDLQSAPGAPVLLSLEPLEDSGARGVSRQVNFEQLFQGADANFELPAMQDPSQWGLFVCRDSRRTGECRQKPLTDVNRAFTEYHKAQQAGRRYTPEDRVYFFQYVLFEGNGTVSVFDHHEVPDENFTRLGDFVGQLAGGASLDEESTSALDFARTRTRDLRSLALKTQYSTLEVELPYASREACTPPR